MKSLFKTALPLLLAGFLTTPVFAGVAVVANESANFSEAQVRGIFLAKGKKSNVGYEVNDQNVRDTYYKEGLRKTPSKILATRKRLQLTGRAKNKIEILASDEEVCSKVALSTDAVGIIDEGHACKNVADVKVLFRY